MYYNWHIIISHVINFPLFKGYDLMNFDMYHPWNFYHNRNNEHILSSFRSFFVLLFNSFSCPLPPPLPSIPRWPSVCFLSLYISSFFLEFWVNGIILYVVLFCVVVSTQHSHFEVHLWCSTYQFISLLLSSHCVGISQFIHSLVERTLGLFAVFGCYR